jgi:hypothetical protein
MMSAIGSVISRPPAEAPLVDAIRPEAQDPAMGRALEPAIRVTVGALSAAAFGLVVLFLQALSEVLADPSLSLLDGYEIGRLPWTTVGVGFVVMGATVALVAGTVASWIAGGWVRRVAAGLASVAGAAWWLVAMLPPPGGAYCADCPAPGPEPLTMAYSLPEGALLFLVLPAVVAGALALSRARPRRRPAAG